MRCLSPSPSLDRSWNQSFIESRSERIPRSLLQGASIRTGNISNNDHKYLGLILTKFHLCVNIKLHNIFYSVLVLAKICDIISSKIVAVRFMIVTNTGQLERGNEIRKARGLHV